MWATRALLIGGGVALLGAASPAAQASHATTTRESVTRSGGEADGASGGKPAVTPDGRFIAFQSDARNLTGAADGPSTDIFVRDRATGSVELASVTSAGTPANSYSYDPSISADGRFIAFTSFATNLVPGDTNNMPDVFLRDRAAGTTVRVSLAQSGAQVAAFSESPEVSANGRYVIFQSGGRITDDDTAMCGNKTCWDTFRHDVATGEKVLVSKSSSGEPSQAGAFEADVSGDGDLVVFTSAASNLVPGDNAGTYDLFARRISTGTTTRISRAVAGPNGPRQAALSADGTKVAFVTDAVGLVPEDTDDREDVYVLDIPANRAVRVSVRPDGSAARGFGGHLFPEISADGRYVTFASTVPDLVGGDTNTCAWWTTPGECPDVFVRDIEGGALRRASVSRTGRQGNGASWQSVPLPDGRVVFSSEADNLVPLDLNGVSDVFMAEVSSCGGGGESGAVSGPLHEVVEPVVEPADGVVHDMNCGTVVGSGL